MLQVAFIRENRETVLKGLAKRNFVNAETVISSLLSTDENRKATQTQLDNTLAESNKLSKDIGFFIKMVRLKKQTF